MNLLGQVSELKGVIESLTPIFQENMITGRVLMYCDLNELKSILKLGFGHWEIFKLLVLNLRNLENINNQRTTMRNESRDFSDAHGSSQPSTSSQVSQQPRKQKSTMEKQVNFDSQFNIHSL